jgi:DNA-binding MarR family transcriptional regulator
MERIEHCISFLLGKAAQEVSRRAREALAAHYVTPVQYAVLRALSEEDGRSGAELGARLVIDSATITGILDRLEASGLVMRRADRTDRRVTRLFLTEVAKRRQPALDVAMDGVNDAVAEELGGEDMKRLAGTLRRLGGIAA